MLINYDEVKEAIQRYRSGGESFNRISGIKIDGVKVIIIQKPMENV